jgi:hypothetical protein
MVTDTDLFHIFFLFSFVLVVYIIFLRFDRDMWKSQALMWVNWLKDESHWNDEEMLNMLTEAEKKLNHLRREYQIDE